MEKIKVPDELTNAFLVPGDRFEWDYEGEKNKVNVSTPFIYEALYYSNLESLKPWEDIEGSIPLLLSEWRQLHESLGEIFRRRDRQNALEPMRLGICVLIQMLHWCNGKPVKLYPKVEYASLNLKPVNARERIEFIVSRPNLYQSYMQLTELISEMEKQYVKSIILKKKKNV